MDELEGTGASAACGPKRSLGPRKKRASIGSGLARVTFGAFQRAATELRNDGTFNLAAGAPSVRGIESFFDAEAEASEAALKPIRRVNFAPSVGETRTRRAQLFPGPRGAPYSVRERRQTPAG
jgi:hypothetical protein